MNKWITKGFVKVEQTFEKVLTNYWTIFSTKLNTFAERNGKHNDRVVFQTWTMPRFLKVIHMVVTMVVYIFGNSGKLI